MAIVFYLTMLIYKTMLYKYRSIDSRAKYTRLLNIDIYISDCPPIEKKIAIGQARR